METMTGLNGLLEWLAEAQVGSRPFFLLRMKRLTLDQRTEYGHVGLPCTAKNNFPTYLAIFTSEITSFRSIKSKMHFLIVWFGLV
jgi:hypothetical protein